ncbi:MAG: thioredoxin family protein [Phycisphaerae bacterium]|jgi:thioredoxin 1|nr:thioredoxin family protein [Phycisphaerae bacterium]MCZ2399878.1 thioredoxin family protein [Phycisphaerae bacterium]
MRKSNIQNLLIAASVLIVVAVFAAVRQSRTNGPTDTIQETAPVATAPVTVATPRIPRMVDLGADKCIPCKQMAPILAELKTEYAGRATIEFIDVWKNPHAGKEHGVRLIPTQIFFDREGKEVWRHEGFLSKAEIVAKLKELGAG